MTLVARRRLARATAALIVLAWLASVVTVVVIDDRIARLGRSDLDQLGGAGVFFMFAEASATVVAAMLLISRPEHPVGWCLALLGISVSAAGAAQSYGILGLIADPDGHHLGAGAAATLASSLFVFWLISIALVCYRTPTGRHLSARWGWCAKTMWISGLLWFLSIVISPGELEDPFVGIQNPWGVDALTAPVSVTRLLTGAVNNLLVLAAFASLALRFRRSVGEERRQLMWLGLVALPVPVLFIVTLAAATTGHDDVVNLAAGGFIAVLPAAIGLAVARTRLYDVDRILSKAATYVLSTAVLAATYVAIVLIVGLALRGPVGESTVPVALATLAVATLARPAHHALQKAVDRRFSRRRYDALHVVRACISSPDPATSIETVLQDALRIPELSVAFWVQDREAWVTGDGRAADPPGSAITVTRAGRVIARVWAAGSLMVEPEFVDAVLHEAEPELENAGLRAAVALQLEDVRASRARLATAQLEERRRVERDLHDGAHQRLLALAAQLQAALINGRPERLREALETGVRESQIAVRELRELANGLHPSVLVDGGLTAALDDLASRHRITVELAEPERRYPPRIEATAWFIACEAVINAVKHAGAEHIDVSVTGNQSHVEVLVEDDGLGGAEAAGAGLRGLADRAEAVGGTFAVAPRHPSGTTVTAVLPCE